MYLSCLGHIFAFSAEVSSIQDFLALPVFQANRFLLNT